MSSEVAAAGGAATVPSTTTNSRGVAKKRDLVEAELLASILESSKVHVIVSNTELKAAKELHLESRLAQLRNDKQ